MLVNEVGGLAQNARLCFAYLALVIRITHVKVRVRHNVDSPFSFRSQRYVIAVSAAVHETKLPMDGALPVWNLERDSLFSKLAASGQLCLITFALNLKFGLSGREGSV